MSSEDTETLPAKPGDVLDGRYRIERLLGRGGMGVVFSAEHLLLRTKVAVKFLLDPAADSVARFAREAQVTARLTSPHVARVVDIATPPGRTPYLVMELLAGKDLDVVLKETGRLPLDVAVGHVLQACDAIAQAHRCGVVHRDIKPNNLFLAKQPDGKRIIKVLDFGLSKLVDPIAGGAPNLSTTTAVMGSPGYMSPEQLRSTKRVDARTDIWALGVVLYELLTNVLPFNFETSSELLIAIASDPHVPIRERRPELPVELEAVISRALSKRPEQRFENVVEFAQAIAPFAKVDDRAILESIIRRSSETLDADPPPSARPAPGNNAITLTAIASTIRFANRRRGIIAIVGAMLFGATVGAVRLKLEKTHVIAPASATPATAPPPVEPTLVPPAAPPAPPPTSPVVASAQPTPAAPTPRGSSTPRAGSTENGARAPAPSLPQRPPATKSQAKSAKTPTNANPVLTTSQE